MRAVLAILIVSFCGCTKRADNFRFKAPDQPLKDAIHIHIGEYETRIGVPPHPWQWVVNYPVNAFWIGFSQNRKRFTALVCPSDGDASTMLRLERPDVWKGQLEQAAHDFAESDADLVRSLRSNFPRPAEKSDQQILDLFCDAGGAHEMRVRGGWPSNPEDIVLLPDRMRKP